VVVSPAQLRGLLDKVLGAIIEPAQEITTESSRATMNTLSENQRAAAMH